MKPMPPLIAQHLAAIRALAREYGVARLEIFGSVCTPKFDPETSDVDFLIAYPPGYDYGPWLSQLQDLEADPARVIGRKVDLVSVSTLDNKWLRREAAKTRRLVYDASQVAEVA